MNSPSTLTLNLTLTLTLTLTQTTLSGVSSPSRKEHSVAAMQNSPRGTRVLKARRIWAIVTGSGEGEGEGSGEGEGEGSG